VGDNLIGIVNDKGKYKGKIRSGDLYEIVEITDKEIVVNGSPMRLHIDKSVVYTYFAVLIDF
jgi:hypothetical protein